MHFSALLSRTMDYLRSWIGRARVTFTHPPEPVTFTLRDGSQRDLLSLVESSTPPCHLNPFLFNGHLQTCWTAVRPEAIDIPIYYRRWVFEAELSEFTGHFAVDFVVPPYDSALFDPQLPPRTAFYSAAEFAALGEKDPARQRHQRPGEVGELKEQGVEPGDPDVTSGAEALGDDDERPMLICLHGLTGGSYEPYLRSVLQPLVEAGWAACVVNSRGCAKSKITSGVLYNARSTWDCRQMVKWCRKTWPKRKLYGIGFSLGANMMVNYIGEEAENCILEAAVVVSNPWTLDIGNVGLRRTFLGSHIYSKAMATNLKKLWNDHLDVLSKNSRVDIDKVLSIKYIHEFDRVVQCPTWGYPTEGAYYRDASSVDCLNAVRIPLLGVNAEDDPISMNEGIPYEEFKLNPYLVLLTSSMGGHLSWFELDGKRWFARPVSNFLMKMAAEVASVKKPAFPPPGRGGLSIADEPSFFSSTRHKLRLRNID